MTKPNETKTRLQCSKKYWKFDRGWCEFFGLSLTAFLQIDQEYTFLKLAIFMVISSFFSEFSVFLLQNLLRDCAREAKIWQKAYHLPSIPDGKLHKFFEFVSISSEQTVKQSQKNRVHVLQLSHYYVCFIITQSITLHSPCPCTPSDYSLFLSWH